MKFAATLTLLLASTSAAKKTGSVRRHLQATFAPGDFSDGNVVEE